MKKIHAKMKKHLSIVLTVCMILTLSSSAVLADQDTDTAAASSVQEEYTPETDAQETVPDDAAETADPDSVSSSEDEVAENPSEENSGEDSLSEEETSHEAASDEELVEAQSEEDEEETEESEFEETGIFSITVTDSNGAAMNTWYDSTSNVYYLFLTNAVTISELELKVEGVKIKKASKGTLDEKTNTVTGAFAASGEGITLTAGDGSKYNVMVKQSGIPSLSITLNGTTLNTINSGSKDTKYSGQSVILTDASGALNLSQTGVEIKGRGNTSWDYSDKKPYQLKFSKKQSVLGMAKAKKWVLLANSFDDSMLRNSAAYYLGDALEMTYSPDVQFVELWVDGEYRGLYTIGEKCEIDSNRLNLTDSKGALMEYDNFFYKQEDYWYYDSVLLNTFALKEAVDEDNPQAALSNFESKAAAFGNYLFNTDSSRITLAKLKQYIDVESFAKWYLVNEYLSNVESYSTSWYWYCDGASDVLHLGPLWDFDTSQGINTTWNSSTVLFGKTYNRIFRKLMSSPAFAGYVKQVYNQYRSAFSSLPSVISGLGSEISGAAENNYTKWQWLGGENVKGKSFASTYAGAVSELTSWLSARDAGFTVPVSNAVSADTSVSVSSSGRYMTVKASNVSGTTSVSAAVWSASNGQDDLKWYTLTKGSDGIYSVKVDLKKHGSSDTYYAHVYSGSTLLGAHSEKVTMSTAKPSVTASYTVKTDKIKITVSNVSDYDSLQTAIWTKTGGQDDIRWVNKTVSGADTVSFNINASTLKHSGSVFVHVYGTVSSKQSFLTSTTAEMGTAGDPSVSAVQTEGGSILKITVDNAPGWTNLKAAVWGAKNGQNDIKWYTLTRNDDGTWTCYADLTKHNETGLYHVHVYGTRNSRQTFAGSTTVTVDLSLSPEVTVSETKAGVTLKAVLKNASSLDSAKFAVWGKTDGQNDLVWYTAKKNEDGTWYANIPLSRHLETGLYYIHAYGTGSGKQTFQAAETYTVEELNVTRLTTELSSSEKTVNVTLENPDSYSSVSVAVWGAKDGQNDIKWVSLSKNLDGTWSASVNLSSHKETGLYYIHAYGVKNGAQTFAASTAVTVDAFAAAEVTAAAKGSSFLAKVSNSDECSSVRFAVWTQKNGQDDLKWYTGIKYTDGSWRCTPIPAAHGGNGTYIIHAYGTVSSRESLIGTAQFVLSDLESPEVSVSLNSDGTKLTVTVTDPIGYYSVKAAVWGSKNGQDDIKWYTMQKNDSGVYEYTVDLSRHDSGLIYIHVYGTYGSNQFFMGSASETAA